MALTTEQIEDGTGKATAIAFADEAFVTAYWLVRGGSATWTAASADEKMAGVVQASDYLCMGQVFDWRGLQHPTGRMAWPRIGASERNGNDVLDTVVPWRVKEAMAILAPRAITALQEITSLLAPAERGGKIRSESGAGFSTTYADDAPTYTVQQDVLALVRILLRDAVDVGQTEFTYVAQSDQPADDAAIQMETYRNPGAA
jgi:hypothetical protein